MNYEIYSCICTCMYACLRVCMHMYVLQCMCTCMYAYVRVCAYVSVCLLHMCTVHVCTYVYLRMCTRTYAGLYWRVCTVQCFSTMLCLYCGLNVYCCRWQLLVRSCEMPSITYPWRHGVIMSPVGDEEEKNDTVGRRSDWDIELYYQTRALRAEKLNVKRQPPRAVYPPTE